MTQQQIQPPRGMNDILPVDMAAWQRLENLAREIFASYAYQEIRVPIVEHTSLFKRSIGEFTDVVSKEMFTFQDPGGDSLTLRPEGTAGIVRAMISNGLLHNQKQRVWCAGPMFRHEKPQRGRFRQFHQLDVEAFGYPGPDIDAEVILLSSRLLNQPGVKRVELNLNSLGTPHRAACIAKSWWNISPRTSPSSMPTACAGWMAIRCASSTARIRSCRTSSQNAPMLTEHLDEESRQHFGGLCRHLDAVGREVCVQPAAGPRPRLLLAHGVRVGDDRARLAGRGLLGRPLRRSGRPTGRRSRRRPSAGRWARNAWSSCCAFRMAKSPAPAPDVYFVIAGERAEAEGLRLAERLRDQVPGIRIEMNCGGGSFKSQLKRADKSGAAWALILGDSETEKRVAGLKSLRVEAPQVEVAWERLADELKSRLQG